MSSKSKPTDKAASLLAAIQRTPSPKPETAGSIRDTGAGGTPKGAAG